MTGLRGRQGLDVDVTISERDGERIAAVMPVVPEDAPASVREGVRRRRLVATTGRCPCGARLELPNRAERRRARRRGRVIRAAVHHEAECPAIDEAVSTAWAEGRRGGS